MPDVDIKMLQVKDMYGGCESYNAEYGQGCCMTTYKGRNANIFLFNKSELVKT